MHVPGTKAQILSLMHRTSIQGLHWQSPQRPRGTGISPPGLGTAAATREAANLVLQQCSEMGSTSCTSPSIFSPWSRTENAKGHCSLAGTNTVAYCLVLTRHVVCTRHERFSYAEVGPQVLKEQGPIPPCSTPDLAFILHPKLV